jgi:zinc transport system substrate-binding protein
MSPRFAERIATAIGGRVESIDPLSADYFGTLKQLADLIAGGSGP